MPASPTKRTSDELAAAAAEAEFRRLEPRIELLKAAVAEEKALTKRLKTELSAMRVALAEARGTATATTASATATASAATDAPVLAHEEELVLDDFQVHFARDARASPPRKPVRKPVRKPAPAPAPKNVPHGERLDWASVNCPFVTSMGWSSDQDVYHSIAKFFVDANEPKAHSYIKKLTYDASRLFRSAGAPWPLNVSAMLHHLESVDAAAADAASAAEARSHLVARLQFAEHDCVTSRVEDLRKAPNVFKKRLAKFATAAKVLAAMHDRWRRAESAQLATGGDAIDAIEALEALDALEALGAQPRAALDEDVERAAWASAEEFVGL